MNTSLKAVLFDFDGTLADSYDAITASVNHVRASHGLPPLPVPDVKKHVGRGPVYLLEHTVGVGDHEQNLAVYRRHHPTVMRSMTRLLDGAAESVTALHARGLKLGVCSNKPRAFTAELLASLGIDSCFDVVVGPEDVPQPKPAPDMLLKALAQLGVTPDAALYVGDMTVDVATARAAGVAVWVVPTGSDELAALLAAEPDRVVNRLDDVPTLLLAPASGE